MRRWLAVVLALGVFLAGGVASAHTHRAEDANDAKGALDLRRVNFAHDEDSITLTVWSYEKFRPRPFHRDGYITIRFESPSPNGWTGSPVVMNIDHRADRYIAQLHGSVGKIVYEATRPFPRILRVTIPRSALPEHLRDRLRWSARANGPNDDSGSGGTPWDFAPEPNTDDAPWYWHDLTTG